jgi:hypothetical protein
MEEARVGQELIPLWVRDYGYSQQGISFLIEKRQKWHSGEKVVHSFAVGDRIAMFSDVNGGGIGFVQEAARREAPPEMLAAGRHGCR